MKLRLQFLALLMFVGGSLAYAQGSNPNSAYEEGDYLKAAAEYESRIENYGPNADVLYNLGNAYFQAGQLGLAIYAFERALVLKPRDRGIKSNLQLAKKAAGLGETKGNGSGFFQTVRFNTWASGVLWGAILAVLAIAFGWFMKSGNYAKLASKILLSGAVILLVVSVVALLLRKSELNRAVVVKEDAKIRLSPFETADVVDSLTAGQSIFVEKTHKDFYRIKSGWVSNQDAQLIYSDQKTK